MPEIPQMPRTTKEAILAIWYKINNGLTGAVEETRTLAKDTANRVQGIEKIIPTLWTREQHENMHAEYVAKETDKAEQANEKRAHRGVSTRDWIMIAIVAAAIFISPWLAHLLEKKP